MKSWEAVDTVAIEQRHARSTRAPTRVRRAPRATTPRRERRTLKRREVRCTQSAVGSRGSSVAVISHSRQSSVGVTSSIRIKPHRPSTNLESDRQEPVDCSVSYSRLAEPATADCDCRPTTPDCRLSIHHPLDEPRPRLPLLEQPADRAVAECDVPLIAIPTASCVGPPGARRSPGAGASVDPAAGHAAAVDGQLHGTAAFDGHAHRNGRPEPPEHRRKRPDRRTRGPARRRRAPPSDRRRAGSRGDRTSLPV